MDEDTYELYLTDHSKNENRPSKGTNQYSSDSLKPSTLAFAEDPTNANKNGGLTEELSNDQILVERDLEQSVDSLGTVKPARPRES